MIANFFLTENKILKVHSFDLSYKNKKLTVIEDNAVLNNDQNPNLFESKTIMMIDNHAGFLGFNQIKKIIYTSDIDCLSGLIIFCNKTELKPLIKLISELNRFGFSVFGINPDYYFSLVPLDSKNRRNVEKYIFNLTSDSSWIGKIKNIIKHFMIYLGLSHRLYEYFVIIATPEIKCLSSNI